MKQKLQKLFFFLILAGLLIVCAGTQTSLSLMKWGFITFLIGFIGGWITTIGE
jgi:hypothetical protein